MSHHTIFAEPPGTAANVILFSPLRKAETGNVQRKAAFAKGPQREASAMRSGSPTGAAPFSVTDEGAAASAASNPATTCATVSNRPGAARVWRMISFPTDAGSCRSKTCPA